MSALVGNSRRHVFSWRGSNILVAIKSIQIEQSLLKIMKTMTPKSADQNICFLNERIHFNLLCKFNGDGFKIQILINKHVRKKSSEYPGLPRTRCMRMISVRKLDGTCINWPRLSTNLA